MTPDWDRIDHVTTVDPGESLPPDLSILQRTDLVVVGGSDDVTDDSERFRRPVP